MVADALRRAIADGVIRPGERIKEMPVAERLGVSRGPIREAIRLLEHDGLVRVIPNRGAVVPEVTSEDVLEVYAMRSALGSLALHKLMLTEPAPIAPLARELERLRRAVLRRRAPEAAEADLRFQSTLVSCGGLPRVTRAFDTLTWQVRIFIATLDNHYDDKLTEILDEVAALYDAIVGHDGLLAEELWRAKFERWVRDFLAQLGGFDTELWATLTGGPARPTPEQRDRSHP